MSISRCRVLWTQFPGAPGYSNFYFDDVSLPCVGPLVTFFTALKAMVPQSLTWTIPNNGDEISETTGDIVGSWSTAVAGGTVVSTSTAQAFSGSSGSVFLWKAADPIRGRRPIGKTYLVPLTQTQFDTQGSINDTQRAAMIAAANSLLSAVGTNMLVWSRPTYVKGPDGKPVKPPVIEHPGSAQPVVSADVPDLAVVMRTRRR